jgi:RimJ/RimL family protein N-acetyltransferase
MVNGKRIKIRHKRLSDAKEDFAWQTDSELAKLDAAVTLNMNYQQYLSEYTFELCYPSPNRHEFAIETLDGKHIGNCVYYNVNTAESKAEMGIMIGNRDFWNQAYGTEAVMAFLDHIFNRTALQRVYLSTLDWNVRAQKCFKKCGFVELGQLVRDKQTFLLMAVHRAEWDKISNPDATQPAISLPEKQEIPQ